MHCYISQVSIIRFNSVVKSYYSYKKSNGLNNNKLMIVCYNKLLNAIYPVMKNKTYFMGPEIKNWIISMILEIRDTINVIYRNHLE